MLLLMSVHIFNLSRANISYSSSTSCAVFLHFTSAANSLFCHTGGSWLVCLYSWIMDSLACIVFKDMMAFPGSLCFQAAFYSIPLISFWIRLKSLFLKPRVCVLVLVFLSSPQGLRPDYFSVTTAKPATEYYIHRHFFLVDDPAVYDTVPASRSGPWRPEEIVCIVCAVPFCSLQVSQKLTSHVKKPKQTGCAVQILPWVV